MENLTFNYISAIYLQQQQQRAVQMALLNRQRDIDNTLQCESGNKKLSFGMDTILGKVEEKKSPVYPTSPSKGIIPFMNFTHQKVANGLYDAHLTGHQPPQQHTFSRMSTVTLPKSKRNRTVFTNDQLERLEIVFERSKYLVGNERSALASELGLNETQVKVWFQNRRIKYRKQTKSDADHPDSCHDRSNASSESESESSVVEIITN